MINQSFESQFIQYLETELSLPVASIALAQRQEHDDFKLLPVILWNYGLVTLEEVSDMFDWLEHHNLNYLSNI